MAHGDLMFHDAPLPECIITPSFVIIGGFHNVVFIWFVFLEKWKAETHFYFSMLINFYIL